MAVSGSGGRLGRALLEAGAADGSPSGWACPLTGWDQPEIDLDDAACWAPLLERDRPDLVIHTAAETRVDECARQPELCLRRNGLATGALAADCRARGLGLVVISTNEVFSGEREDGRGYVEDDEVAPRNPYGASKLAGEAQARTAYGGWDGLWVVRTAWLYGPPGNDFPDKIVAASDRLAVDEALPVVADEVGSPTYTRDLAAAILSLVDRTDGGLYHVVNAGRASRRDWADRVLAVRRPGRQTRPISASEFSRASDPPRWGVLDGSRAAAAGVTLRPWEDALGEYLRLTSVT